MSRHRTDPSVERSDVRPRAIAWTLFWFFAALLSAMAMVILFTLHVARHPPPTGEFGPDFSAQPVPRPLLESDPVDARLRREDAARRRIDSLGWSDRRRGLVHIPVEAAMRQLAASGWPEEGNVSGPVKTARAHAEAGQ
jgi:hypothetical protein